MKKILVTGATGNIASVVIPKLVSAGADIRALVHDESKAEKLVEMGVEVVSGDFRNPDTLAPALEGVDRVLLIVPVVLDAVELGNNVIAAAKKSDNPHIVFISSNVPEPVNDSEVGRQRTAAEGALINSGLPYTIIRPTFFMQNTMMAGQTVAADGMVYLPMSDGRMGMVDVRDVGAAVASVMVSDGHEGKTYTLTGPASISVNDIASDLSAVIGKDVTYVNVPFEAAKAAMMGMGMPDWLADMYNGLFKNFGLCGADFTTDDVELLTGQPAIPYKQFAQDFAWAFQG